MSKEIQFTLDGKIVTTDGSQSIWQIAKEQGTDIPHLCYKDDDSYRADGNCRACMVEIEGERVLAASCLRTPTEGMVVNSQSARADTARKMVMELLVSDQPPRTAAHDPDSQLWQFAEAQDIETGRFPASFSAEPDSSHPAIAVNMDACVRAARCRSMTLSVLQGAAQMRILFLILVMIWAHQLVLDAVNVCRPVQRVL